VGRGEVALRDGNSGEGDIEGDLMVIWRVEVLGIAIFERAPGV